MYWPRGKVLGGSSIINGMYLNRPGETDIEAWHELLDGMDDADNWNWEAFLGAMKKSETFTPPKNAMAAQAAVAFDASSRGTKGPIQASYPGSSVGWNGDWAKGLQNMGVVPAADTYGGKNCGGYISTSTIDPNTWKRSSARSGYLDALSPRTNYDVLANAHVTRIIFDDDSDKKNLTASAIEFSMDGGATMKTVQVNSEVILAGGSIGSPAVLLHSGVGPKDVLNAAGVEVISELPGVGNNLQDHLLATVSFKTSGKTPGATWVDDEDQEKNDQLFLSFVNDAVAYINASRIFGTGLNDFQKSTTSASYSPPSTDKTVQSGYSAIAGTTASTILTSSLGQVELLLVTSAFDGTVGITAALQHPFSHGAITIASNDPFQDPLINPNYLTHPSDVTIFREGLKLARQLGNTPPFSSTLLEEVTPGTDKVSSDADWEDWLREYSSTEFHPSSTCAMLPLELGGVVDANLKVYGLANVRVADASVPPISFSAHLMGSTYGIAEQASDIIRRQYNIPKPRKEQKTQTDGDEKDQPTKTDESEETATEVVASSTHNAEHNGAVARGTSYGMSVAGLWLGVLAIAWS